MKRVAIKRSLFHFSHIMLYLHDYIIQTYTRLQNCSIFKILEKEIHFHIENVLFKYIFILMIHRIKDKRALNVIEEYFVQEDKFNFLKIDIFVFSAVV